MFLKIVIISLLYFTKVSISAPIDAEESDEKTQLLDYYQSRVEDGAEFRYELSDGQMREEKISYDDLDSGIAVKGSYTIELEGGEMQTIYYISDTRGHRISINVPFDGESKNIRNRPAPTRKPQNHAANKNRFQLAVDEKKLYEENRIEDSQRKGRIQAGRKIETSTVKVKAEDVAKPVAEVVEEVKIADVKVEGEIKSEDDSDIELDEAKPEEQVTEEGKSEEDDHTEESAKDGDHDEK